MAGSTKDEMGGVWDRERRRETLAEVLWSAAAEGEAAVAGLLDFAEVLSARTRG